MRAVACQRAELEVVDLPEPVPARGQVRLEVLRCGICGSDLHARHGIDEWAEMAARTGYDRFGRSDQPIVFGHEFSGSVAEYGPGCGGKLPTGTPVVARAARARRAGHRRGRPFGPRARRLRRAADRPGVDDDAGAQRAGARRRGAHRADGRRLARRPARRGQQARRGDRHRLRAGRPRRDPVPEGQRRARPSWPATSPPGAGRWRPRAAPTS